METYKQTIKEKSRKIVWEHAVESLTKERNNNEILNEAYMTHLWEYVKTRINEVMQGKGSYDESYFEQWISYSKITYGAKRPCDLKVAFLCGPEPENDVKVLLSLGIRIENIYAFESDNNIFKVAVDSLRATFPLLKIFNGKIENFIEINAIKFDIIYLDFTGSLLKEFKTIIKLLDSNVLTPLSVLAINTTYPDITDDYINFLTHYFFNRTFFESDILKKDNDLQEGRFIESCSAYSIDDENELKPFVQKNYEATYSAFQTDFINLYSNIIKPIYSVVNNRRLLSRLFDPNNITSYINDTNKISNLLQDYAEDGIPLTSEWVKGLNLKDWSSFFKTKEIGHLYNREEASLLYDIYDEAEYLNYEDILSDTMKIALPEIDNNLIGGRIGLFCDVPMIHLWMEQIVNQYGYPYHVNMKNHKRYEYQAKTRKMCLDIFTLDSCRSLYDWLPMIEYYAEDLTKLERQMISRMCLDAIDKHTIYILDKLYFGSAIVGISDNPKAWNAYYRRPDRQIIN